MLFAPVRTSYIQARNIIAMPFNYQQQSRIVYKFMIGYEATYRKLSFTTRKKKKALE